MNNDHKVFEPAIHSQENCCSYNGLKQLFHNFDLKIRNYDFIEMVQICYNASSQSYKHYSNNKSLFHQEELEEPTFNWCIRTVQEFKAPFLDKTSSVYRQGLRLVSLETAVTPCSCEDEPHKWGMVGMCSTIVAHKKNISFEERQEERFYSNAFNCIQTCVVIMSVSM